MANFMRGRFYEFHVERVISQPGQPIATVVGAEIGPEISKEAAIRQVREGMDVYTLNRADAYKLATSINAARPVEHAAHNQAFYAHYHPGGVAREYDPARPGRLRANIGPGHVFYGDRSS